MLSLASPVLHKMLCGSFNESVERLITLDDVNIAVFTDVLELWLGKEKCKELKDAMAIASVADRFEMTGVLNAVEQAILAELQVGVCAELLSASEKMGLPRIATAARHLALTCFEEVADTAGFLQLDEEALSGLLADDSLHLTREEKAFEGLVAWMRSGDGGDAVLRGRALLREIRFPLMDPRYLAVRAHKVFPAQHIDWISDLLYEAFRARAVGTSDGGVELQHLGPRALVPRTGLGIKDGAGRTLRLREHCAKVLAVAGCHGRLFSGSEDGVILVWQQATLAVEQELCAGTQQDPDPVCSLLAWESRLVSGHRSGRLRAWDVDRNECVHTAVGHMDEALVLAECGRRMASGSADGTIMIWKTGVRAVFQRERALVVPGGAVTSLGGWGDKVVGMSADGSVRVWDVVTGVCDITLCDNSEGLQGGVLALHKDRLVAASEDCTVRVWVAGSWVSLGAVTAVSGKVRVLCMAVSGATLVCGAVDSEVEDEELDGEHVQEEDGEEMQEENDSAGAGEEGVRPGCWLMVMDLDTMEWRQQVRLGPAEEEVAFVRVIGGETWCGVGNEVVAWGRR